MITELGEPQQASPIICKGLGIHRMHKNYIPHHNVRGQEVRKLVKFGQAVGCHPMKETVGGGYLRVKRV